MSIFMQDFIQPIYYSKGSQIYVSGKGSFNGKSSDFRCFYFPQFKEIIYTQRSAKEKQKLNQFVKQLIKDNKQLFQQLIDPDVDQMEFRTFNQSNQLIVSEFQMMYQLCNRVDVRFKKDIHLLMPANRTKIIIKKDHEQTCQVSFNTYSKFQVKDVFIMKNLFKNRFTALKIDQYILKHYQPLGKFHLKSRIYQAVPLFTFQLFYHQMHKLYNQLERQKFDFQTIIECFAKTQQQINEIQRIYTLLQSNKIDKLTHYSFLYLTGGKYNLADQKKYMDDYFYGKTGQLSTNKQSIFTSLMLNCLERLPNTNVSFIYLAQQRQQQEVFQQKFDKGQIVRIQNFCPAVDCCNKLNLHQQNSYNIYEIQALTAKNVGLYNGQMNNLNHIILPFGQYLVQDIKKQQTNNFIRISQLSTPKKLQSNLVLWIGEDFRDAKKFQQRSVILQNTNNQEVILIKNIDVYQLWLKKYFPLTVLRKLCVVYNMRSVKEGLKALELTRIYLGPEIIFVVYTEKIRPFAQEMNIQKINTENVKLTHNYRHLVQYVVSSLNTPNYKCCKCEDCQCQDCKCVMF